MRQYISAFFLAQRGEWYFSRVGEYASEETFMEVFGFMLLNLLDLQDFDGVCGGN
jgi:hypothetical protein